MLQQGVIIRKLISQHHETAHDLWNGHLGAGCLRTIFYHKRKIVPSSDLGELDTQVNSLKRSERGLKNRRANKLSLSLSLTYPLQTSQAAPSDVGSITCPTGATCAAAPASRPADGYRRTLHNLEHDRVNSDK